MNKTKEFKYKFIIKIYSLLKNDFRGVFFNSIKLVNIVFKKLICTKWMYFFGILKNIKYGSNMKFYGISLIERAIGSKIEIGNNCKIRSDVTTNLSVKKKTIIRTYNKNANLKIGNNVGINGSVIAASENIRIGNDVLIGYNCYISDTDNHVVNPEKRHIGKPETAPICIEDNVWLGVNVVVLKGVTIGKNSVIGANSLVLFKYSTKCYCYRESL